MTTLQGRTRELQDSIWNGSLPLEIRLSPSESRVYDQADPYFVQWPRVSYLPFLLSRVHAFFHDSLIESDTIPYDGWFSYEDVPLKWQYPLGLLYDLFSGSPPYQSRSRFSEASSDGIDRSNHLPWRLTVHFTNWPEHILVRPDADGKVLHDAFINAVKEADFLRNGTAKGIMSLSKEDSTTLWKAVQDHDFTLFNPISKRLIYAQGAPLRHIPLKIYLPSSPTSSQPNAGHLRIIQSLITPHLPKSREVQGLGTALNSLIPSIFPSRRTPILAKPVLHGVVVPMQTPLEELMRVAAYLDGWLHVGIVMIG